MLLSVSGSCGICRLCRSDYAIYCFGWFFFFFGMVVCSCMCFGMHKLPPLMCELIFLRELKVNASWKNLYFLLLGAVKALSTHVHISWNIQLELFWGCGHTQSVNSGPWFIKGKCLDIRSRERLFPTFSYFDLSLSRSVRFRYSLPWHTGQHFPL